MCVSNTTGFRDAPAQTAVSQSRACTISNERLVSSDQLKPKRIVDVAALGLKELTGGCYELNSSNPLVATKHSEKTLIWQSREPITASHVEEIVTLAASYFQSVHINTGTHGDQQGNTSHENPNLAEGEFLAQDFLNNLNRDNVSIFPVSSDANAIFPEKANHIIMAWCYSIETPLNSRQTTAISRPGFFLSRICECGEVTDFLGDEGSFNVIQIISLKPETCDECEENNQFKLLTHDCVYHIDSMRTDATTKKVNVVVNALGKTKSYKFPPSYKYFQLTAEKNS